MAMWLTADPGANELLERDPLALLVGMLLDQHIVGRTLRSWTPGRSSGRTGVTSLA